MEYEIFRKELDREEHAGYSHQMAVNRILKRRVPRLSSEITINEEASIILNIAIHLIHSSVSKTERVQGRS